MTIERPTPTGVLGPDEIPNEGSPPGRAHLLADATVQWIIAAQGIWVGQKLTGLHGLLTGMPQRRA